MRAYFLTCSSLGSAEQQAAWNDTVLGKTAFATQIFKRSAYSGGRPSGGVNLRDSLRRDDDSQTPLQFIYEAADCRMWFTAPMINDVTVLWKETADTVWKGKKCVQGSTGDKSSISGGGQNSTGERPPLQREAASDTSLMAPSSGLLGWMVGMAITWSLLNI